MKRWSVFAAQAAALLACLTAGCSGEDREVTPSEYVPPDAGIDCEQLGFSDQGDVRVFVVGHKQRIDDAASYDSFEESYRRHARAIEPCLAGDRPNLLAFPENAALGALLIGSRGEQARDERLALAAFVRIINAYAEPLGYYRELYPDQSPNKQVLLALTDVVWRATQRTFAGIARDFGVWVMANADVAPAELSRDPALVAKLGDPDLPDQNEVWVASGPEAYNMALLYDPGGARVGRVDKVFLTDDEEELLDLDNGSLSALRVLDTPFARIGVATSRDAFYPPFMQRLDDLGAELVVQPEAFSGWTIEQLPGDWLPDVFLSSAWLHQQKYTGFVHNVTPQYTGNFFDLVFDGQVHISQFARPGGTSRSYVGQDALPGWLSVGPWVEADPGRDDPSLSLDARRAALREVGQALLPGSGSPLENAYVDSVVAADLSFTRESVAVQRDSSKPESRAIGTGRNPDVASDGSSLLVAWESAAGIAVSHSSDGTTWLKLAGLPSAGPQRRPAVCVAADGRVGVVWQEGEPGEETVRAALAPVIGQPFDAPIEVSPELGWEPDCGFFSGELAVVYTSLETGVPKLRYALHGAAGFAAPLPVDPSTDDEARLGGAELQPAVSADGQHVVWLDYRERSWDVRYARFGGTAFTTSQRLDGSDDPLERLNGEPRVEASADAVVVTWTDLRDRRAHPDIGYVVSSDAGLSWSARRSVPGGTGSAPSRSAGGGAMPRYRPALVVGARDTALVFQDLSPDKSAIFRSVLAPDGTAGAATRVDDTADAPVHLTRPRAAALGAGTLVVWEDDRDGAIAVYSSLIQ